MPRIPFADVKFPPHDSPSAHEIEVRLKFFLEKFRKNSGSPKAEYMLPDADRMKIRRRTKAYLNAI